MKRECEFCKCNVECMPTSDGGWICLGCWAWLHDERPEDYDEKE